MAMIIDAAGVQSQIPIDVTVYKEAEDKDVSVRQLLNQKYPTSAEHGPAFNQILASEGIFFGNDKENGIRSPRLSAVLDGSSGMSAAVTRDAVPTSRIVFPAAILSYVEDKLLTDLNMTPDAFEKMIAITDSIPGDKFDRPVLNFSKPEAARHQGVSQLALPNSMLTVTVSELSRRIPTFALGLEVSEQATKNVTIDLLSLGLARQAAVERAERADNYITSMLNGDKDMDQLALSAIQGKVVKAKDFDATATPGVLTQASWMNWLIKNGRKRRITHVVTDIAGALAIENRVGKPVIVGDNANSPRINTLQSVMNPTWSADVQVFITNDPAWPANTIMGIDNRYAIHRVTSISAQYQAIEQFVMRRGSSMRFDFGEVVYRLFDEAFEVLTLT